MADKPMDYRIFIWAGISDVVVGLGLVVAGLTDLFGPDMEIVALTGGVIAVVGVGLVLWGRNKASQAEDRRGDLS